MRRIPLLAAAGLLAGCVAAAVVGAAAVTAYGVVKYKENEAYRDYRKGLTPTWEAVLGELKEMGYPVTQDAEAARQAGGIDVDDADVKVESLNDDYTRVTVRIGTFETDAHKRKASRLLNGVAERLGEASAP